MVVVPFVPVAPPPCSARDPPLETEADGRRDCRHVTYGCHVWLTLGNDAIAHAGNVGADDEAVVEETILDTDGLACRRAMLIRDVA